MRVVVLTTSYPRAGAEHSGQFVADSVEHLRGRGIEIEVLAPGSYRTFGLAGRDGVLAGARAGGPGPRRSWSARWPAR